ncbi:hypothetical protein MKW94_002189 [Papaver nudicaule]|uniref:H15 domain-containing protein n=1 Tax=Papaver nudicaule TaxID=74823 RepID=A0AA41RWT4_PAPNU|nr:hypothetical protein [Papaver nudicaule]
MITEAISSLKAISGSSQHAIAKFIAEKYYGGDVTQNIKRKLRIQLNELTQLGKLVKVKRSFKLPAAAKKSSAVEEEIVWDGKYVDKFERLSEEMIPDEELIQKEKANVEEWKKVAAVSTVDLAIVGSMEKLMQVKQELVRNKKLWDMQLQLNNDDIGEEELTDLYEERSKIIESIPDFWSTVFMNDYSLRRHMNDDDKKIITYYLKSVVVEGRPYVTSNPHFENSDLTKIFHFSCERITGSSGTKVKWKKTGTDQGICTSGLEEEKAHTGMHESFFTWFEEESTKKLHDEVVNIIANDLWCYAPNYYIRAKRNCGDGKMS